MTTTPPDAAEVRARIVELRRRVAPSPSPPPPLVSPSPPPSRARHAGRAATIAGGIVGGAGVILIAAGAGTGVDGDKQADALTAADQSHRPFDPAVEHRLQSDRAAETGLVVVGAAATATGVVLILLGRRADARARRYASSAR